MQTSDRWACFFCVGRDLGEASKDEQIIGTHAPVHVDLPKDEAVKADAAVRPLLSLGLSSPPIRQWHKGCPCRLRSQRIKSSLPTPARCGFFSSWAEAELAAAEQDLEAVALLALRSLLAPIGIKAVTALRFARARNLHVAEAAQMYINSMEWRGRERVDLALGEPAHEPHVEAILSGMYGPRILDGLDRVGRPVIFVSSGRMDVWEAARHSITVEMLLRRVVRENEQILAAVNKAPNPTAGHLLINDLNGCTVGQFLRSFNFFRRQAKISADYYPELMGTICLVRGPSAAAWAVKHVKNFLEERTAEKIELHSGDPYEPLRAHLTDDLLGQIQGDFS